MPILSNMSNKVSKLGLLADLARLDSRQLNCKSSRRPASNIVSASAIKLVDRKEDRNMARLLFFRLSILQYRIVQVGSASLSHHTRFV